MNNKEAIKEIEQLINKGIVLKTTTINIPRKSVEALEVAIEALQERPKGRWIELPCEIGDIVYFIDDPRPAVVEEIRIIGNCITVGWVQYDKSYELTEVWDCGGFDATDIGKTVFFTPEEAEKALADMKGE